MSESIVIPRHSLTWLLMAFIAILLPHAGRLPLWLMAAMAACIGLRILIFQGRLSYPGRKVKTLVVSLVLVFTILQYGRDVLSNEAMIGILMAGIALKLLEMHRMRDVMMIIFLNYFASLSEFIYSQSIPMTLYMLGAILLNSTAMMSLQQTCSRPRPLRSLRMTSLILVQSMPVMLVLFLLVPRLPPLWNMPSGNDRATTGISDRMGPGDIGNLMQSAEVAFKVQFEGEIPANEQLYWRGLTLDLFNGRFWTRRSSNFDPAVQNLGDDNRRIQPWYGNIEWLGQPVSYDVIMEPSNQNWLFALKMPNLNRNGVRMNDRYQLESRLPVTQRLRYSVQSWLINGVGETLDENIRRVSLLLPEAGNERSRELANELRSSVDSNRAYVEAVLAFYNQESFFYTLQPRLLGDDPVDAFLFDTREGFCEHYASSFTFLMRVAGIPARVVTGYQGGERNPYDDTLIVRQFDAHAWSEVWLEEEGWVRVDPTAAVAPERISMGSELSYQNDEGFLRDAGLTARWMRNNLMLNELRLYMETIDYAWARFVINYDQETQFGFFTRLFGVVTRTKVMLLLGGTLAVFLLLLAWVILRPLGRRELPQPVRLYLGFCRAMEKLGYSRGKGETPGHFHARIAREEPALAGQAAVVTRLFSELTYLPEARLSEEIRKRKLREMRRAVRRLRLAR